MNNNIPRVNILGTGIHTLNMKQAVEIILNAVDKKRKGYVCVTGVHGIIEAQKDPVFADILNQSFLTTPDGMPTVWTGRSKGHRQMDRVYGPDMMLEICHASVAKEYTHFLYGGKPGIAEDLSDRLKSRFPGIQVVGTYTPPFRPLKPNEESNLQELLSICKPDLFWVGLSTPKQEKFMAKYYNRFDTKLMIGVGAAFDVHTGHIIDAPHWVKRAGLQWFHRLLQDPKRLWRRYLINNPLFLWKAAVQLLGVKKYGSKGLSVIGYWLLVEDPLLWFIGCYVS
ncbi:MAG: WecB/TagA/CpsF family glycosyltransferase [Kiritimatiellae bacterium]|nr:WecB/TagA/CpsF family glycosyltransferase [Kiritimatiellia bacterium]